MAFNRFGNMNPPKEYMENIFLGAVEPFKLAGNLYYVGNIMCSTYLIDTGKGYIILDTPTGSDLTLLINSMWKLGFDPKDIKYIIVSHAHMDHYGSVEALKSISGAVTCLGEPDVLDMKHNPEFFKSHTKAGGPFNESFVADISLKDGSIIELGNTKIRCVLTPGHTIGTMSHFWELVDNGVTYKVGIYGGAGFITLTPKWMQEHNISNDMRKIFVESIDKVWDEEVDIMLGNHPFHNDLIKKYKLREAGKENPFIDPDEWHRFLQELKDCFYEFCMMSQDEIDLMYSGISGFNEYVNG